MKRKLKYCVALVYRAAEASPKRDQGSLPSQILIMSEKNIAFDENKKFMLSKSNF